MKKDKIKMAATTVVMIAILMTSASANNLTESEIGRGIIEIINDASGFLIIAGPLACGAFAAYSWVRRGMASEQDAITHEKRTKAAIIAGVACGLTMAIVKLFASYFA